MQIPKRVVEFLKKVPLLREAYHIVRLSLNYAREIVSGWRGRKTFAAGELEEAFETKTDPWNFEKSELEKERFDIIWRMLPDKRYERILEIGCAEGHFTEQIAARFDGRILSVDFMPRALERAAQRCSRFEKVSFRALDVSKEAIEGNYDLIFCMAVLEYGPRMSELRMIRNRIVSALEPGGHLVLEGVRVFPEYEKRWWTRLFWVGARAIHDRFLELPEMVLVDEARSFHGQRLASLLRKKQK